MTAQCFSSVRGRVLRITKLDSNGAVVLGANSQVVSDGFIKVDYAPNLREGQEIEVVNAAGSLCVSDTTKPQLKGYNLKLDLCSIDPSALGLLTGNQVITDTSAKDVGFRVAQAIGSADFAIEVWTDIPAGTTATKSYGYFLLPWVTQGVLDAFSIENNALTLSLNAKTAKGGGWGTGPTSYKPINGTAGAAAALSTPIGATDHLHVQVTTIAPPTAACGTASVS